MVLVITRTMCRMNTEDSRPISFPSIHRHGVIGDRRTGALVAADGTHNWFCVPNFDSPPLFGTLLDPESGGFCRFGPARASLGRQRYLSETAAVVTSWRVAAEESGAFELTDVMAWPLEDTQSRGGHTQIHGNESWESIVQDGLRKTYRQGRGLMRQVVANAEPSDEEWHELRKRVKDLGYQLNLLKKVRGIKPLLRKLDEVGTALGDARDLTLLRDCLGNVQNKNDFTPSDRWNYQKLLTHVEKRSQKLHRQALKVIGGVYRRGSKRFTARLAKRFHQWQDG